MTRANSFFIQAMIGLLLLIVIGGCAPGSSGSGTGPSGVSPTPLDPVILPTVPNGVVPTGELFSSATVAGIWYDASNDIVLNLTTTGVRLVTPCVQFESTGAWLDNPAVAAEVTGTYISRNPLGTQPELSNGRVVISKPQVDGLFTQFLDRNGATVLRTSALRKVSTEPVVRACIN